MNHFANDRIAINMPTTEPRFEITKLDHGRTAFDPSKSRRHIRSCHVDLDEFYSRLRIIYRERNDPRCWMTFRKD